MKSGSGVKSSGGIRVAPRSGEQIDFRNNKKKRAILLLIAGVLFAGCSRDPLAKARAQKLATSDGWKVVDNQSLPTDKQNGVDIALFMIKSKDQFDTPEGRAAADLFFFCRESVPSATIRFNKTIASGDVRLTFDNAAPLDQKWDYDPSHHSLLEVPRDLGHQFAFNLSRSKIFQVEFMPKGGSRQRATFALYNLRQLMGLESSCRSALTEDGNPK